MATEIASATDAAATLVTRDRGQKGLTGDDGIDGAGFNSVRQSLIDSPLCRFFAPNNIATTLAGSLTATRATTGTYVDRYGVVQTAAIDVMRQESNGWLVESTSTNVILQSQNLSSASWTKSLSTVSEQVGGAPDGGNYYRVTATANSGDVRQNYTPFGGASTLSFWAKAVTPINIQAFFNGSGVKDIAVTTQWQRFTYTIADDTGATSIIIGDNEMDGAGKNFDLWGVQVESKSTATSYIPTTTTSATRAADIISAQAENNTPLFSGAFSVCCNVVARFPSNSDLQYIFSFDNGDVTATDQIFMLFTATSVSELLARYSDGVTNVNRFADLVFGDTYNLCMTFDGANFNLYVNSVAVGNISVVSLAPNVVSSDLYLGSSIGGASQLNSNISDFRIYDFVLNADEIKYLSGIK